MASTGHTNFHSRFDIKVNRKTVESHFINRVLNLISSNYSYLDNPDTRYQSRRKSVLQAIANCLGERYQEDTNFADHVRGDFIRCLMVLEAMHSALAQYDAPTFTHQLASIISQSEADLGVRWANGNFLPSGAKSLDEALVNDNLQWLSQPPYRNVLAPFQKGLSEFLQGQRDPNKLIDTVRDMYEALEAMAKVVTGRANKELSANRQLFVSKLALSEYYAKMLIDYIDYACTFRHAVKSDSTRTPPRSREVEAFIHTTGLFLRLALQSPT